VPHNEQYAIRSELDQEFADFVRGVDDNEAAELMDRWFEPFDRAVSA
jgi:hypothetical protein